MAKCKCCGSKLEPILIGRSSPDEVCVVMPGKGSATYRQELEDKSKRARWWRNDIVLLRVGDKQLCVFAYTDGVPRGEAWEYLDTQEREWCIAENKRILAVAAEFPAWGVFLHKAGH